MKVVDTYLEGYTNTVVGGNLGNIFQISLNEDPDFIYRVRIYVTKKWRKKP
jgi:hypothetical protein